MARVAVRVEHGDHVVDQARGEPWVVRFFGRGRGGGNIRHGAPPGASKGPAGGCVVVPGPSMWASRRLREPKIVHACRSLPSSISAGQHAACAAKMSQPRRHHLQQASRFASGSQRPKQGPRAFSGKKLPVYATAPLRRRACPARPCTPTGSVRVTAVPLFVRGAAPSAHCSTTRSVDQSVADLSEPRSWPRPPRGPEQLAIPQTLRIAGGGGRHPSR